MEKAKKIIVLVLSILALICIIVLMFINIKCFVYELVRYNSIINSDFEGIEEYFLYNNTFPMIEFMFTAILLGLTALSIIFANFLYFKKQLSIAIAFSKQEIDEKVGKMRANRKQAKKEKLKNKLEEMEKDT